MKYFVKAESHVSGPFLTEVVGAVMLGVGATAIMDLWAIFQRYVFNIASLDYAMVGRWIGHMRRGRFVHNGIGGATPIRHEKALGWGAHYAIGIIFAGIIIAIWGAEWLDRPTLMPTLVIGVGSVVAPFFVMQPGLGAGILASRTPAPWTARFRTLVAHTSFAVGLYLTGVVISSLKVFAL